VRWEQECSERGIQPLFGCEFAIWEDPEDKRCKKPAAWGLAEDLKAFYNFTSDGIYTEESLAGASGIIRFAGAALSDPQSFDYIDLNPASPLTAKRSLDLYRRTGKPLVLTCDNSIAFPEDRAAFLAISNNDKTTPQWILTEDELRAAMYWIDDGIWELAKRGTYEVAERLNGLKLNRAPIINYDGDLRALVEEGRQYRLGAGHLKEWTQEYEDRVQYELEKIEEKSFESYFLVVSDLVRWAKTKMLVGPARGSSAGSLVCYLLRITEVDPIPHHLLFERFIDSNRADLPDIDIDFSDRKRDMVFDYLRDRYGERNVSQMANIMTLKSRSVMAEAGKRLGIPAFDTFAVKNVLIEYSSGDARFGKGLEDTLQNTQPGRDFMQKYPAADVMGLAENHCWNYGKHAAAILVCNEPITDFCTVRDGVAQIDKPDSEYLNLLKIDALGLRTLGVIEDTGLVTGDDLYALTLDDPNAFSVFNDGKFAGLFQFAGAAQRRVSRQIPVVSFRQIDHCTALARPGPLGGGAANTYINRNAGTEETTYHHPSMEAYLGDTHGVVLYQEQVMRIVREIGQFTWAETSIIRKAMSGRKGQEFMDRQRGKFKEGAVKQGIDEDVAETIWNEIYSFGAWGMNACIVEDQRVKIIGANQTLGNNPTIGELYDFYVANPSDWVRQRKSMPLLLSADLEDGVARPQYAKTIHKNGPKPCVKLTFDNGSTVSCTKDHKFVIDGEWKPCGDAAIGSEFTQYQRVKGSVKDHTFTPGGKGWRKGRSGGAGDSINNRNAIEKKFRLDHAGSNCQACGCPPKKRMIVHHNDFQHGKMRPDDLMYVCDSCHKNIHMEAGDWLPPYGRGWKEALGATLIAVEDIGVRETYDIEMPEIHNYVLANGIVTHNSHTCSYAIISYWCAWMKYYHPVEYAAALLRNAKDDEEVIETLRELRDEGVPYTPFDVERSELDWAVKDGVVVGGFTNLKGIGPAKGKGLVERRNANALTEKDLAVIEKSELKYSQLNPAHELWGEYYDNPEQFNVRGPIKQFKDLTDFENACVICKLIRKDRRDENEQVRVARRNGQLKEGQTLFLDCFVVDDSTSKPILMRIKTRHWFSLGIPLADKGVDNEDWFLVRGKWLAQFSMITVDKIKCLTNPSLFD